MSEPMTISDQLNAIKRQATDLVLAPIQATHTNAASLVALVTMVLGQMDEQHRQLAARLDDIETRLAEIEERIDWRKQR